MGLFIVRHQHAAERCPASDPYMGANLLNYLSRPNVRKHGIEIQGEAVVRGEHTLYMIVESDDEARVWEFMQPFAAAGEVNVYAAATCAGVVSNGGCGSERPETDPTIPALDPEDACQWAIDGGLVVHRAHPLNCETSLPALVGGVVMPNASFYVRNHFQIPKLNPVTWRLSVDGFVDRPLSLSLRDLTNMPSQTRFVTLECAGNGRSQLDPSVKGEQWRFGAVSTAEWTGVPLVEVLDRAGVKPRAQNVLFRGMDSGLVDGISEPIHFERSLSIDEARGADVLLAYAMNGEPLPVQHGYPLRVIVPSWYAVASVKWLTAIEVIGEAFQGHCQKGAYFFEWQRDGHVVREPVTLQRVRSLITEPDCNADTMLDAQTTMTIGMDLGDQWSRFAVLDGTGELVEEGRVRTRRGALRQRFASLMPAIVALEVGPQSAWVSDLFTELGHSVVLANPREVNAVTGSTRKSDREDARVLARLARVDASLLHPVRHGCEEARAGGADVVSRQPKQTSVMQVDKTATQ